MADLSFDIFYEILTRTSSQLLSCYRLVSRDWNCMTYESNFIKLHRQRTNTISGYFVQNLKYNIHSSTFVSVYSNSNLLCLDFLPTYPVRIESSSYQGIMLCKSQTLDSYYICKPSTKQWKNISFPNPNFIETTALLILRSNPLHYKIIRLTWPENICSPIGSHYLQPEIFDSKTDTWKLTLSKIELPYGEYLNRSPPIVSGGLIHWLTNMNNILVFYEDKETWEMISPPKIAEKRDENIGNEIVTMLANYEGKLGMICMESGKDCMEIWVMKKKENFRAFEWEKIKSVDIKALKGEEKYIHPIAMDNSEVVVMKAFNKVIFYNFLDFSCRVFRGIDTHNVFPFQSDFEYVFWE